MLNGNRNPGCVAEHRIESCKKLLNHSMAERLDKVMKMKDHFTKYESVATNAPKNVYKRLHIEINRLGSGVPNGALDKIPAVHA